MDCSEGSATPKQQTRLENERALLRQKTSELANDRPIRLLISKGGLKKLTKDFTTQHDEAARESARTELRSLHSPIEADRINKRPTRDCESEDVDEIRSSSSRSSDAGSQERIMRHKSKDSQSNREAAAKDSKPRRKRFCSYMYDMDFHEEDDAYEIVFMIEQIGVTHGHQSKSMPYIS